MEFEVMSGAPAPEKKRRERYNFSDLDVNQYFEVERGIINKVRAAAAKYKERNPGWDYATRKVDDDLFRLWRVA